MLKLLCSIIVFLTPHVHTKLINDTPISVNKDLRNLPDQIIAEAHNEMREILAIKQRKYPRNRGLLDVDMRKQLMVDRQSGDVIYGFGWKDDQFMRCYHPDHYEFSKPFNNVTDSTGTVNDIDNTQLYNRYKPRALKPEQMQCMLYVALSPIQWIESLRIIEFRMVFRSPCMPATVTRVFTADFDQLIPVIADMTLAGRIFSFEFDDRVGYQSTGVNRRSQYDQYKLLNFYVAVPNFLRYEYLPDAKLALQQYESLQSTASNSQNMLNNVQNYPADGSAGNKNPDGSPANNNGQPNGDKPKDGQNPVNNQQGKEGTNGGRSLSLEESRQKAERRKIRKLYKNTDYNWLPYKGTGMSEEILWSADNRKPYYEYSVIQSVWEGNNPTPCQLQTQYGRYPIRWETRYITRYDTNYLGVQVPSVVTEQYPVYEDRRYSKITCSVA